MQQIKDGKIKEDLYRVLKEVDLISEQFDESGLKQGDKLTLIRTSMIGGASISYITLDSFQAQEYAQFDDNVKITMSVKGKRGLYTTNIYDKDILIYKGWIDVPTHILYEDTSNGNFTGVAAKYGSYDKAALKLILNNTFLTPPII